MAIKKKFDHNIELNLLSEYMTYYIDNLMIKYSGELIDTDTFEEWKSKKSKKPTNVRIKPVKGVKSKNK